MPFTISVQKQHKIFLVQQTFATRQQKSENYLVKHIMANRRMLLANVYRQKRLIDRNRRSDESKKHNVEISQQI